MSSSTSSAGRWRSSTAPIGPAPSADRQGPRRPGLVLVLAGLLLTIAAGPSRGHDIPDERVDRALQLRLEPPVLRASYELSLSEWTLFQDLKRLAPDRPPGGQGDRIAGYAALVAPLNARGLLASVDGSDLDWRIGPVSADFEQHVRLTFTFEADVPASGRLVVRDTNYLSSYGTARLAMSVAPGTAQDGYAGPAELDAVPEVPSFLLTDEQEADTREVAVTYRPSGPPATAAVVPPQGADPLRPPTVSEGERRPPRDRLTRFLLDPGGRAAPWLLLAAAVIGAAHAIQPGHGKTAIVGVSLQGDRPVARGVLLAMAAAASHVAVAMILAVVAVAVAPRGFERIDVAMTRGIGLVLAIVGAWRVGASVHGATPGDGTLPAGRRVETARDAMLSGIAVGAIPCWDAVLLLALAWVAGQVALGVALVVAFSLGASATLLGVALAAGAFRTMAGRLAGSTRLDRTLGLVGGLLLGAIGSYLFLA